MQKKAARRGQRALAFLLCLLMVATLLPVMGASAAKGDGGNEVGKDAPAKVSKNPVLDKFLTEDASGNYTLTLTAYATGTTTTVTEKSGKPLDIVLVLDQSGSMSTSNYVDPLKTAVTNFVNSISKNANEYNVDHRIALVGYASRYDSNSKWVNTGLFINGSLYNYQEPGSKTETSRLTEQNYQDALVSVNGNDGNVATSITNAISKINGNGATYTNYGMEMANGVFQYNPIEEGSDRQRIVVVFTDGEPGRRGYDQNVANAALSEAYKTKNKYGATVYTVGLYSDASTNVTTFMKYLSSNYPKAQSMENNGVTPVTEYLPAAHIYNYGTYYYSNNGKYERVYYCDGGWTHAAGWYTQQHGYGSHPGTPIDPNTTQFYVQQTTTPSVADKYYMTTSSSGELDEIFHNISEDIQRPSTDITLNDKAELRDQISNVFDVKDGSTITVSTVEGTYNAGGEPTWETKTQVSSEPFSGKNIGVTGFDYSSNYIAEGHPGQKLVVTVTGLIPNDGFGDNKMFSNDEGAGIYESVAATTPAAEFPLPWTTVPVYTKVLDFSMTADIATSVQQTNSALVGTYGTFAVGNDANKKLTYSLGTSVSTGNLVFDGVDSVLFYGDYNDDGNDTAARWNKVNVIPANNVYFDDDLLDYSSDFKDSDQGYDSAVTGITNEGQEFGNQESKTFTFTGTGIDVYCTTEKDSGWVRAALTDANGNAVTDADDTSVTGIIVKNQFESGKLYNVPTISFDNLTYGTYKLTITTMTNSRYKIDGVRVYNPANVNDQSTKTIVDEAYAADGETKAVFKEVRDILIDNKSFTDGYNGTEVNGVVFIDQINGDLNQSTSDVIGTYKPYGPKNEVYLAKGQGIAFKLDGFNATTQKLMIGLSAPQTGSGSVDVTNDSEYRNQIIAAATDMYYRVTPNSDGYVYIRNAGESLISVTNIKITGENSGAVVFSMDEPLLTYVAAFDTLAVTQPTPDPDPTPESPNNNTISAIIHAIWSSVRESIDRLFGK